MEETKRTPAALAAEKEIPRAALDGVLTIDVDSKVESICNSWNWNKQEENSDGKKVP